MHSLASEQPLLEGQEMGPRGRVINRTISHLATVIRVILFVWWSFCQQTTCTQNLSLVRSCGLINSFCVVSESCEVSNPAELSFACPCPRSLLVPKQSIEPGSSFTVPLFVCVPRLPVCIQSDGESLGD